MNQATLLNAAATTPIEATSDLLPNPRKISASYSVQWIVDSGARNQITCCMSNFFSYTKLNGTKLQVLNGYLTHVMHIITVRTSLSLFIRNVFFVPAFKLNLLSIGKLLAQLNLCAIFLSNVCVLQDLST